jgi:predicted ATPase
MTHRYVLTGAPGAGKTVLLHALAARGWPVVEEAATDVIAALQADGVDRPWTGDDFCDRIVALQQQRQRAVPADTIVQIYDRSPLCTLALACYLDRPVTPALRAEVDRVLAEQVYEPTVFLIRPLGFIQPTPARRITYADSLTFQAVHEAVYRDHGFTLTDVPAGPPAGRADLVESVIDRLTST